LEKQERIESVINKIWSLINESISILDTSNFEYKNPLSSHSSKEDFSILKLNSNVTQS